MSDPLWLRLHLAHAHTLANSLATHQAVRTGPGFSDLGLLAMVTDPGGTAYNFTNATNGLSALIAKCSALAPRVPVVPAVRLMASGTFTTWLDAAAWTTKASWLRTLATYCDPEWPLVVGLDIEPYAITSGNYRYPSLAGLTANGYSAEDLATAMRPFLDAVRETGAIPWMHPAVVDSEAHRLIYEAAGNVGEAWVEETFGVDDARRKSIAGWHESISSLAQTTTALRRAYGPGVGVRAGLCESYLRAWGAHWRNDPASRPRYGELAPWMYDWGRGDQAYWGTPEWVAGTRLASVNDVAYCWHVNPFRCGPIAPCPPLDAAAATAFRLLPWGATAATGSSEIVSDVYKPYADGLHLDAGLGSPPRVVPAFRVYGSAAPWSIYPSAPAWTLDLTVALPSSLQVDGVIASSCLANGGDPWQVMYRAATDEIVLRLRKPTYPPTYEYLPMLPAPPRGVPLRIQVGRDGDTWLHSVGGSNARTSVSFTVTHRGGTTGPALYIGMGTEDAATSPNTRLGCVGTDGRGLIVSGQVAFWHRLLTGAEVATVNAGTYPYNWR